MGPKCQVRGCKSDSSSSLHLLPCGLKDPQRYAAWVKFVKRTQVESWVPVGWCFICSLHFEPECFSNHLQFSMGLSSSLKLHKNATPSIYPHGSEPEVVNADDDADATLSCDSESTLSCSPAEESVQVFMKLKLEA